MSRVLRNAAWGTFGPTAVALTHGGSLRQGPAEMVGAEGLVYHAAGSTGQRLSQGVRDARL